ncbi:sulfotransferase family protein [Cohnella candidum]|uniref:Sulfotransferase domain-containing protein n=1 Tax=Cohnella candidum TaxID=2674991 RepID=A0A3G3K318_9BACL|nr:hypothetical protein [Cohnella candidum]AYQ74169.1 hypothetical protein EAV92_17320 [Cohnella candidum]
MIARAINALGVYFGEEVDLLQAKEDNKEGFWEHQNIVRLNDEILEALGIEWHASAPLDDSWWTKDKFKPFEEQIVSLVEKTFVPQSMWGWKDPRTSILIPLWIRALKRLDIELQFVIPVRNPIDVASSLANRDEIEFSKAAGIWQLYTLSALHFSQGFPRLVVQYDKFVENPVIQLQRLGKFMNVEADFHQISEEIINPSLRHKKSDLLSLENMANSERVTQSIVEAYSISLELADKNGVADDSAVQFQIDRVYNEVSKWRRLLLPTSIKPKLQIFWKELNEETFVEHHSLSANVDPSTGYETFRFPLASGKVVRIDPIDQPGLISIRKLAFTDGNGMQIDLIADAQLDTTENLIQVEELGDGRGLDFISLNKDPQMIFRLPGFDDEAGILEVELKVTTDSIEVREAFIEIIKKNTVAYSELASQIQQLQTQIQQIQLQVTDINSSSLQKVSRKFDRWIR